MLELVLFSLEIVEFLFHGVGVHDLGSADQRDLYYADSGNHKKTRCLLDQKIKEGLPRFPSEMGFSFQKPFLPRGAISELPWDKGAESDSSLRFTGKTRPDWHLEQLHC